MYLKVYAYTFPDRRQLLQKSLYNFEILIKTDRYIRKSTAFL